jgi:hypothetical protein
MRVFTAALAVSLVVPLSTLSAQQPPPVEAGARVQVTAPDCGFDKHDATLEALRGDRLVFDTTECPLGSVTRLDVSRGRKRKTVTGAVVGVLAGVAVGGGLAVANSDEEGALIFVPFGALAGTLLGTAIGTVTKTERWEEVPLDQLRVSVAPQRDGRFGFGISVVF